MIKVLEHPVAQHYLATLRNKETGISEFRNAVSKISNILAVESFARLQTKAISVETPMEVTSCRVVSDHIVLMPILRAGMGLHQAFIDVFDHAETGFMGLKRNEETIEAEEYHFSLPEVGENTKVFILEVMLATGGSVATTISRLLLEGVQDITVVSIISAPEGIERIMTEFPEVNIFTAALDAGLDKNSYIVPGLGDAGDRLTGTSL
jgi:uracil phosphoribosyltransferase